MCEAKPGLRCSSDACSVARDTAQAYYEAFGNDSPDIDPLTSAESYYDGDGSVGLQQTAAREARTSTQAEHMRALKSELQDLREQHPNLSRAEFSRLAASWRDTKIATAAGAVQAKAMAAARLLDEQADGEPNAGMRAELHAEAEAVRQRAFEARQTAVAAAKAAFADPKTSEKAAGTAKALYAMEDAGVYQGEAEAEFVNAVERDKPLPEIKERYQAMMRTRSRVTHEMGQLMTDGHDSHDLREAAKTGQQNAFSDYLDNEPDDEELVEQHRTAATKLQEEISEERHRGVSPGSETFGNTDRATSAALKRAEYNVMAAALHLEHRGVAQG